MPSFNIVSRPDLAEVENALQGLARGIAPRFDFNGSKSSIAREEIALYPILLWREKPGSAIWPS